uniref:Ionotropic glutamate receptor C-terminal domain-containing protein n=1 Tax=Cannabis sativa TaxID=3483 RepID=A0A803NG76_CANSA
MMMIPCMAQNDTTSVKVGVVLDMETQMALDLIKNVQVKAILGPHSSSQAKFIIDLGQKAQVPIISFSATSPSLIPSQNSYFFQTAISDSSQVKAINSIVKLFGWRKVVPIYTANEYGEGIIPYLVDALGEIDVRVPYRSVMPPLATDDQIKFELYKLNAMQTRVFVVHMSYDLGLKLFSIAKKIGMLERGYVWIITQDFTNLLGSSLEYSSNIFSSMEGVLGIKTFVPQSKELDNLKIRWKAKFYKDNNLNNFFDATKLNVMGYWAYDSVRALALAVEKIGSSIVNNDAKLNNVTNGGSTDLDSFGVSKIGPKLLETLSGTRFEGIAGNFSLDNGQLETLTFQIVNIVNGGGEREIGFWIQKLGLVRTLLNSSESNLGPIIWPGESTLPPKGWDFATNGKRLRIGIPVKSGFNEFVKVVNYDSSTNISDATGFTIDVFKAVVKVLPYALLYDFFPYVKDDGESAGTYDDLVYQVYLGKYDAVVADSTIRANRSKYVDFTLPYTMESGVAMVVPMEDNKRKSAWIFIKPLTWDLWIAILCFFLFIGFVVWVLEHRINEDFRGPPSHQIGTSFWFSFSTMVFAHKERVISNLARFVLIIWVFVIFILTQSYTASLTSLLTVQQLQPTISDINQLLKSGQRVGYLGNSFVYGLLRQTGFPASQIVAFDSAEECDQFLTMGNAKGGVAAVVEETPNMKPFLAQYCNKYTMIGPIFKTDGFGFTA